MKTELDKAVKRTQRYWHIDGLTEIAFGGICLLLCAYFYLEMVVPKGTQLSNLLGSAFLLIILTGSLLAGRFVNALKNRITYPRTGYVAYRKAGSIHRWISAGLGLIIAFLASSLLAASPSSLDRLPAITGLILGAVLLYFGYKFSLMRFYILSIFSLVAGFILAFSGTGNDLGLVIFYGLISLALFASGSKTLRTYLKENQQLQERA
jgi:hypothetical protein